MNRHLRTVLCAWGMLIATLAVAQAPANKDILGAHDMSGASSITGPNANACIYCHIPHSGVNKALWNQTLSTQTYTLYSSGTDQNTAVQPPKAGPSSLCLSCHDGTVALGQTVAIGTLKMSKSTITSSVTTHLEKSHPISLQLPIKDAANLVSTLASAGTTKDAAVKLENGNVECATCHEPHNQYIDKRDGNFLVRDNTGSAVCLACHETNARTVNGVDNSLSQWTNSVHYKSTAAVASKAWSGHYSTMAEYGCASCHVTHNAAGPGLLRVNGSRPPNVDDVSQNCYVCHDGSTNMVTPLLNVLTDFQKTNVHPYGDSSNQHLLGEPNVLDKNRHSTCADCHNSHATNTTTTFTNPPALRPSQNGVKGVAIDGTELKAATNNYENCLRCHAASQGKQSLSIYGYMPARAMFGGDKLNVLLEFNTLALSQHPVMRDATGINQPSLLKFMWDVSGKVQSRAMGTRLMCTDCHNSNSNREFGGTGANGPHGSTNDHILERPYLISKVDPTAGPGSKIINTMANAPTDPTTSPFAMCAKCHDLANINSDVSWADHSRHVQKDGFSCSVCHSAHGVPAGSTGTTGKRLVSFDMNVVTGNKGVISYNGATCTLVCHNHKH